MLTYPNLIETVARGTLDALAESSGLTTATLAAVLSGRLAAPLLIRYRLFRILDADPVWLFRLPDDQEALIACAPSRYVTDPATLRAIDGRPDA